MSYAYLFKYIIIGDTGELIFTILQDYMIMNYDLFEQFALSHFVNMYD